MAISDFQNFEVIKNIQILVEKNIFGNIFPLKTVFRKKTYVIEPVQVSFGREFQLNTYKNGRVMHFFHFII